MHQLKAQWLGKIRYSDALEIMMNTHKKVQEGDDGVILLCEHESVITMGRRARKENLKYPLARIISDGIDVCEINRGGDVTFHGPGQLVGYPIINIGRKVRQHVDAISKSLIDIMAHASINAVFRNEFPGLWVEGRKIAAIGIEVKEMVSLHGFSLNVTPEFRGFDYIIPCGIDSVDIAYWSEYSPPPPLEILAKAFASRFGFYTSHNINWI
ncbi:MAG: lipoyl(octanoyl) transferase LipB [Deltaproteobacteria bacterium]|nr:lipoyl(octanoyl) transferase LipB [Deltaproteobacteria bacterium]